MRRAILVLAGIVAAAQASMAQAVPDQSQAARTDYGYRRPASFRFDPFRHVIIPHWGFIISGGVTGENNAVNVADIRALVFLDQQDSLRVGDALDALGLVPRGSGLTGGVQGSGGLHLGGPLGRHLSLGLSAQGNGYGSFQVDDDAVALLRDGNGARQEFTLGDSKGAALATADAGLHFLVRLGPLGSVDGAHITLGFGARYLRPIFYAQGTSLLANGGRIAITGDSIVANIAVESRYTVDAGDAVRDGSGFAGDFLIRAEWPTSGFALEAMVANVGSVSIPGVERRRLQVDVAATRLDTLFNNNIDPLTGDTTYVAPFDTLDFRVIDTTTMDVTLPRVVRVTASAWANRILQIDVSATAPITGEFESPLAIDIGTTWRFVRVLPLRAGLVLGGRQGLGYFGGFAVEGRTLLFRVAGQSLGGLFGNARGAGARVELGLFF